MITRRIALAGAATLPLLTRRTQAATQGHLRFGLSAYPPTLAPWANAGTAAGNVQLLTARGLTGYGPDGTLRGEMAESWTREGEATWVFKLRDAVWQNGKPVEAEHIKWNLEQIAGEKSTAYMRTQMRAIERIETPDARTIKLVMKSPDVTVPLGFATFSMTMVYPESATPAVPNGVGAGPFVLKSAERGVGLELAAFDRYYKPGFPKLTSIKLTAYADENLRVAALHAGDVDLIEYVPWQSMGGIEADRNLVLQTTEGPYMYLVFNGKAGPMADKRVRQAIGHAIKRDDVVKAAFFGRGAPMAGLPIEQGTPFVDPTLANAQAYDPARAKALLAEAGHPDGFSAKLLATAQYGMHKDTAAVVQQNLADIGIEVELVLPDWATRVAQGNRGQYEFAVMGTGSDSNDPDGMSNQVDTSLPPAYGRSINLPSPKVHDLLAQGRAEFDEAKRKAIYDDVQRQVIDDANFVGVAWRAQGYAFTKEAEGLPKPPGRPDLLLRQPIGPGRTDLNLRHRC